jgi:hypothetical protein
LTILPTKAKAVLRHSNDRAAMLLAEADPARQLALEFPNSETAQALLEFADECDELARQARAAPMHHEK